jgi:hypothetical protein
MQASCTFQRNATSSSACRVVTRLIGFAQQIGCSAYFEAACASSSKGFTSPQVSLKVSPRLMPLRFRVVAERLALEHSLLDERDGGPLTDGLTIIRWDGRHCGHARAANQPRTFMIDATAVETAWKIGRIQCIPPDGKRSAISGPAGSGASVSGRPLMWPWMGLVKGRLVGGCG